jgi:hypothetical protein
MAVITSHAEESLIENHQTNFLIDIQFFLIPFQLLTRVDSLSQLRRRCENFLNFSPARVEMLSDMTGNPGRHLIF